MCPVIGVACQPSALTRMYAVKKTAGLAESRHDFCHFPGAGRFSAMSIAFAMLVLVPSGQAPAVAIADQVTWSYIGYLGFGIQVITCAGIMAGIISSASMYMTVGANAIAIDLLGALNVKMDDRQKIHISDWL